MHPSTVLLSIHTVLALLADLEKLPRTGRRVITSPLYPNTTPNFADLHPPARDKLLPFSKRLRVFCMTSYSGLTCADRRGWKPPGERSPAKF